MTELESLVALNMIDGLGPVTIRRLLAFFGSAEKACGAAHASLMQVEGIGPEIASKVVEGLRSLDVSAEIARIEKDGYGVIGLYDAGYPEALKQIYDAPPLLYVRGAIQPEDQYAIAVVGARRCSHYGDQSAARLASQIVARGLTVVSGLARGIDTSAHRGALKAGGRTIAVLGSGLGRIYPPENKGLAEEIAASGAVISEFPLSTAPAKNNFPLRNRIISGLSLGVVVVEAARRSGSLITALLASEQGRVVFAVPGRIDSFTSEGTHDLIKDGAKLVESVEDICEEFPYLFPGAGSEETSKGEKGAPRPHISAEEERILKHLEGEERAIDEIVAASGLTSAEVSSILLSLELKHLVNQLPGKMFQRSA